MRTIKIMKTKAYLTIPRLEVYKMTVSWGVRIIFVLRLAVQF